MSPRSLRRTALVLHILSIVVVNSAWLVGDGSALDARASVIVGAWLLAFFAAGIELHPSRNIPKGADTSEPRRPDEGPAPSFSRFVVGCHNGIYHLKAQGPAFDIDVWGTYLPRLVNDATAIAYRAEQATLETMQAATLEISWAGYTCWTNCVGDRPVFHVTSSSLEADALMVRAGVTTP